MATFPSIAPHRGTSRQTETRVLRNEFGDGYTQRLADGLNTVVETWSVTWTDLTITDADTIDAFLTARNGVEAFEWTPPRESVAKIYTCVQWSRQPSLPGTDTINATFKQEFDLA